MSECWNYCWRHLRQKLEGYKAMMDCPDCNREHYENESALAARSTEGEE